jgi:hypothetical protein
MFAAYRLRKELNMIGVGLLIAGVIVLGLCFIVAPVMLATYRRYRERRTIVCPENDQLVEIDLQAGRASMMAALGKNELRVKWCSLWPRRKGCGEACIREGWANGR